VPRSSISVPPCTIVWDIQTGIVFRNIPTWDLGKIAFSGNQTTFTLIAESCLSTYHGINGKPVREGRRLLLPNHKLGAQWAHDESLRFAISSKADRNLVINIQELQPTSDPPLPLVESFSVPLQGGIFSFSPVSFHASFVSETDVVIFDVRNPETPFQARVTRGLYTPPGHFSPNGRFFACGTSRGEICIWENTPAGYTPWSSLRRRLPFEGFLFSPVTVSILTWGPGGVQLLHPDNRGDPPTTDEEEPHRQSENHLAACSEDGKHIVTTRRGDSVITVLDLSSAIRRPINASVEIRDIKIVGNIIFVTDGRWLSTQHLETDSTAPGACGARSENVPILAHVGTEPFALSNDCSQIAITLKGTVFLYDVGARKILDELATEGPVIDIRFSPDGHQLWLIVNPRGGNNFMRYCVGLEGAEGRCFVNVVTECLEGGWSWDDVFRSPDKRRITGSGSEWVSDSRSKVLWFPPSWRSKRGLEARWNGNVLALVGGHHPEPIIIEFKT
jgi:WD40 repeat protein